MARPDTLRATAAAQSVRLEDYLNDKLQTFADFETLDFLLANVQNQQDLLRQQLHESEQELQNAEDAYRERHAKARGKAETFQRQQADIDRRIKIITRSETSDDASRRFSSAMEQLRRLDMASGYLETLEQVELLRRVSKRAQAQLQAAPDEALESYNGMQQLTTALKSLQKEAEGAAPHLIDHVEQKAQQLRATIRDSLTVNLETVLQKFLWPKPDVKIPEAVQKEFHDACSKLLVLQKMELLKQDRAQMPAILLPLEILVKPLATRFHFHFSGQKPTNRLDKPEYFLSHVLDLLSTYSSFVDDNVQPVLLQKFRGTDLVFDVNYIDATAAFITALLPMLREKIFALVPQVSGDPRLLSHFMHEVMDFDKTLRSEWRYTVTSSDGSALWKGLAWEVLAQQKWFDRWLKVEQDFALARYQSIIDDPDSSTLDYDSLESNATKPTKAAIRVNDLLETITERYRPLVSFSQKLRFLIDIQISIFDRFHSRLHSSLEAFLSMTSSIGRTVQGVSAEELAQLKGTGGLDRLCRVFGSADYLERAMRDWSDDVFFLDLWNELQFRAKSHNDTQNYSRPGSPTLVAGPLSLSDVAARTSSTLETDDTSDVSATGALFDETAAAYARLRSRAEGVLTDTFTSAVRDTLRPYARANPWSSLSTPASATGDSDEPATSVDLNGTVNLLNSHLGFLAKALGTLPLRRVGRHVAHALDAYMFDRVVMGNTFSLQGARQVDVDVNTLAALVDRYVGGQAGSRGMGRSLEACRLLALKVRGSDGDGGGMLGLWEVEKRLFEDNESARLVLEETGCLRLSEAEAREVVRRRVEVGS